MFRFKGLWDDKNGRILGPVLTTERHSGGLVNEEIATTNPFSPRRASGEVYAYGRGVGARANRTIKRSWRANASSSHKVCKRYA